MCYTFGNAGGSETRPYKLGNVLSLCSAGFQPASLFPGNNTRTRATYRDTRCQATRWGCATIIVAISCHIIRTLCGLFSISAISALKKIRWRGLSDVHAIWSNDRLSCARQWSIENQVGSDCHLSLFQHIAYEQQQMPHRHQRQCPCVRCQMRLEWAAMNKTGPMFFCRLRVLLIRMVVGRQTSRSLENDGQEHLQGPWHERL